MAASRELALILSKRDPLKYKALIERAALNGYHDHKFDSIVGHPEYGDCICPKMQLVQDLSHFPELVDILDEVINGNFDDPADEVDKFEMRMWLLDDGASNALFEIFGITAPTEEERQQWADKKLLN